MCIKKGLAPPAKKGGREVEEGEAFAPKLFMQIVLIKNCK